MIRLRNFTDRERIVCLLVAICVVLCVNALYDTALADSTTIDSTSQIPSTKEKSIRPATPAIQWDLTIDSIYERSGDPFGTKFEWLPITENDWSAKHFDTTESADALTVFEYSRAKDKPQNNTSVVEAYFRRRIFNAAGKDQFADINYIFNNALFDSLQILGRTILPDGSILPLDTSLIIKNEAETPDGRRITTISFSLPGVTDDCIIEYYLRYYDFSGGMRPWYYQTDIPTLSAKYFWYPAKSKSREDEFAQLLRDLLGESDGAIIIKGANTKRLVRDERPSAYVWQNTVGEISTITVPNNSPTVIVFVVEDAPAFNPEPFSIPDILQRSRLIMYRTEQDNTDSFWKYSAALYHSAFETFATKKKRLTKAIKKIKKNNPQSDWINEAYRWTQREVLNAAHGDWYLGKSDDKKPKKRKKKRRSRLKKSDASTYIDDTLKKSYGSAYHITLIFNEALKELGVTSHLAFVTNRDSVVFSSNLPFWQFDHLIILAKSDSVTYVAYDPATPFLAPGTLRWKNEGVTALVLGDETRTFVTTPISPTSANSIARTYSINQIDEQGWQAQVKERLSGHMASTLRETLWPHDSTYHVQEIERIFFPEIAGVKTDSLHISNVWNREAPIELVYNIRKQHEVTGGGKRLFLPLKEFFGEYYSPFTSEYRHKPIVFDFPYTVTDVALIQLPEQWTLQSKPDDLKHTNKFGSCQISINSIGKTISLQRLFRISAPFVDADYYQEVRDLFSAREGIKNQILSLIKNP